MQKIAVVKLEKVNHVRVVRNVIEEDIVGLEMAMLNLCAFIG